MTVEVRRRITTIGAWARDLRVPGVSDVQRHDGGEQQQCTGEAESHEDSLEVSVVSGRIVAGQDFPPLRGVEAQRAQDLLAVFAESRRRHVDVR